MYKVSQTRMNKYVTDTKVHLCTIECPNATYMQILFHYKFVHQAYARLFRSRTKPLWNVTNTQQLSTYIFLIIISF